MLKIRQIIISNISGLIFCFFFAGFAFAADTNEHADVQEKKRLLDSYNQYYKEYINDKNNPRSIHNFAVINFKLGYYDQAKLLFKKLLKHKPMENLAKYNLALVANRQSYIEESIYWFQRLLASKPLTTPEPVADKRLRQLAKIQLKKLKAEKLQISQSFSSNSYFFLKYGHDDNVIDPVGNVTEGDYYTNFYGLLILNFDNITSGLKWRLSYYLKDYSTYNGDDFDQISTDVAKHFKHGRWQSFIRAGLYKSTYGPTDYLSTTRLEFDSSYKARGRQKYQAALRFEDIKSDYALYNIYEGSLQRLDLKYEKKVVPHKFQFKLSFEENDRADKTNASGGVNRSYSPGRQKLELRWYYNINKRWKTGLTYEYRDSKYNDYSILDSKTREDQRSISKLSIQYKISKAWSWKAEISAEDNNSNISDYSYYQNIINTGITGYF